MGLIETVAEVALPQIALPLRLMSWVRRGGTWLLAHPMTVLAALAAVFGAVEYHEASKWAVLARQRAATITTIQQANARAIQQATAAKETKDAENAELAANSDRTAADLRDRYHSAVLQLAASQDRGRSTDLPSGAEAPARSDRSSEGALVPARSGNTELALPLAISRDDALTCADNTARLQAVHDWVGSLGD